MTDLVPCPLCGGTEGYVIADGDTRRWWNLVCTACGDVVAECRADLNATSNPARHPTADTAWNEAGAYAEGLRVENAALRDQVAAKLVDQTMLTQMLVQNGSMYIGLNGGACALLANAFGRQFLEHNAPNYIEMSFDSPHLGEGERLTVTMQKVSGKTAHMLRVEAEAERDKLRAERDAAIIERNQTLARWESALTKNVYNLSSLDGQLDSMRIERDRLAELCRHVHDRILRGDSDKELLDLLEEAWR